MPTVRRIRHHQALSRTPAASRYGSPTSDAEGFGHAPFVVAEQTKSRKRFFIPPQGCGRWTLDLFIAIWFAWLAVLIVGFGYMLFSA